MSLGRLNGTDKAHPVLSNEQYSQNKEYLDRMQKQLDQAKAWNEASRRKAEEVRSGLSRIIEDGKTAERILATMDQSANNDQIFNMLGPRTIEQITASRPSLTGTKLPQLTYSVPSAANLASMPQPRQQAHPQTTKYQHDEFRPYIPSDYRPASVSSVQTNEGRSATYSSITSNLPVSYSSRATPSQSGPTRFINVTPPAQLASQQRFSNVSQSSALAGALGDQGSLKKINSTKTSSSLPSAINSIQSPSQFVEGPSSSKNITINMNGVASTSSATHAMSVEHSANRPSSHTQGQRSTPATLPLSHNPPTVVTSLGQPAGMPYIHSKAVDAFKAPISYTIMKQKLQIWLQDPKNQIQKFASGSLIVQKDITGRAKYMQTNGQDYVFLSEDEWWSRMQSAGLIRDFQAAVTPATPTKVPLLPKQDPTRTPQQANKKTLARDILRALEKRPRLSSSPSLVTPIGGVMKRPISSVSSSANEPAAKKKALESAGSPSDGLRVGAPAPASVYGTVATVAIPNTVTGHLAEAATSRMPLTVTSSSADVSNVSLLSSSKEPPQSPQPTVLLPPKESNESIPLPCVSHPPRTPNTPLFLPSPSPSSPSKLQYSNSNERAPASSQEKPKRLDHVLVPPPPDWVKRYKARTAKLLKSQGSQVSASGRVNTVSMDPKERKAVEESLSRLRECVCRWQACDVVSNSANHLLCHLAEHEEEQVKQKSFVCSWQLCGRHFLQEGEFHKHLQGHARNPLYCPYIGCDESFRTARQLVQHNATHEGHRLRRDTRPVKLAKPDILPGVANIVPAYMIEARAVAPCPISVDRHAALAPWVLHKISAPQEVLNRYSTRLRSTEELSTGDYEFLAFSSTYTTDPSEPPRNVQNLCDLNSSEVSELASEGLVIWAPPSVKEEEETVELALE